MPGRPLRHLQVKSVAIIGAGPSGLAAARYLLAEAHFTSIDVYEQSSTVGGVWNYNPGPKHDPPQVPIPQEDTDWDVNADRRNPAELVGPLYDNLEVNIPWELMGFSDHAWPANTQVFPPAATVQDYLEAYSKPVRHLIKFNTRVTSLVTKTDSSWSLSSTTYPSTDPVVSSYDAVILASGHYAVPSIPSLLGLEAWHAAHPHSITHSMFYRNPSVYAGQKTLVIGNGASGTDIASQLIPHVSPPLLHSFRSETIFPSPDAVRALPALSSLDAFTRTAIFADGTSISGIDRILFCTGYFYSTPFLSPSILKGGAFATPLYKHLLVRTHPTLAVMNYPQRIIPFPTGEAQAAVVARLWSGRLPVPEEGVMREWEETLLATREPRGVHALHFPEDADYIDELRAWAASAGEGGKLPAPWGGRERWLRERFPEIKKAFAALGEARRGVYTVKELGFDYELWKMEQDEVDRGGIDGEAERQVTA